jgi:hypothetical protein
MNINGTGLSIARAVYKCPIIRKPFNCVAELCGKAADYRTSVGTPLLPKYRYGRIRLILSNDPYWNNPLMQLAYREAPKSKTILAVMRLLATAEPIKDDFLRQLSTITPDSLVAAQLLKTLDAEVSSDETYTCDGITSFRELFTGKFTQPPKMTGGFHQKISPSLSAFLGRRWVSRSMPEFYTDQMRSAARILKGIEILSHFMNGSETIRTE